VSRPITALSISHFFHSKYAPNKNFDDDIFSEETILNTSTKTETTRGKMNKLLVGWQFTHSIQEKKKQGTTDVYGSIPHSSYRNSSHQTGAQPMRSMRAP